MGLVKILAVVPYQGMAEVMNRLAGARKDFQLTVRVGNIQTCRQVLRQESEWDYDVIVSRGGTAMMLRELVSVPVIEIEVSVYDALRCLKSVQGYNGRMAVVGFSNITECVRKLSEMMQYRLDICNITEQSDVEAELIRLRQQGIELVLCDQISRTHAEALGMNSILLTSDETEIVSAFDEAVRVCRLYGGFRRQNEMMRTLLFSQEHHMVCYDEKGGLLFSTLEQDSFYEGFSEELDKMVFEFWDYETLERDCRWKSVVLTLSSKRIFHHGIRCLLIRIGTSKNPLLTANRGVSISTRTDQILADISQIGSSVLMGDLGSLIAGCYGCTLPVLIIGEPGTGKDTIASLIYRHGPFGERMMVTVDCQTVSPRRWRNLLDRENSPLMRSGITLHLRLVNCLSEAQADMLLRFIEQTGLCRRSRMIFSCELTRGETEEGYICGYLKNHFSTITLRLPPLRQRQKDIPGLAALYINQVNLELGRQYIGFEPEALALLQSFGWDENLTQLSRVVRTLALTGEEPHIGKEEVRRVLKAELPRYAQSVAAGCAVVNLRQPLDEIIYDVVRLVLEDEDRNQSRTAARLGISRSTVWSVLKKGQRNHLQGISSDGFGQGFSV